LKARLNSGRRIVCLQEQLLAAQRLLREQATRDALTGVWNRAAILDILDRELNRARREGSSVGILLGDLDHFKEINDTHGHLAGDRVLHTAAQRLQAGLRPYDAVGRYGGEEFLVVLPGCDNAITLELAERLRGSIANEPVDVGNARVTMTVSLGAVCWQGETPDALAILRAVDEALYQAKHVGRNQAVFKQVVGS
jgi:two-component system, cell cycle response regulator